MNCLDGLVEYLWGDVAGARQVTRTFVKIIATGVLALLMHEVFAHYALTISTTEQSKLEQAINDANEMLLKSTQVDKRFAKDKLQLCLLNPTGPSNACEAAQAAGLQSGIRFALAKRDPQGRRTVEPDTAVELFSRHRTVVTALHMKSSSDGLARMIERIGFNSENVPVSEMKLCAGTAKLLTGGPCRESTEIQKKLAGAIDPIVSRLRPISLFIGFIQWGTLAIFLYAMLESFGLWIRWVHPQPRLYSVESNPDGTTLRPTSDLQKAVDDYQKQFIHSLGDRLFLRSLLAANTNETTKLSATNEETVSTLESYRVYLLDEAASRQELLEMLGDTMLKLAFLGTVFGISEALFAARALDTSDPILKLAVKSEMYSGIGIGFGTTLVGIGLSILAAIVRSSLAKAWETEIGRAYRLTLDYSATGLRRLAEPIRLPDVIPTRLEVPRGPIEIFGALLLIGTAVALSLYIAWRIAS